MGWATFLGEGPEMAGSGSLRPWCLRSGGVAGLIASLLLSLGCQKAETPPVDGSSKPADTEAQMGTTPPKEPGEAAANDAAFAPMVEVQEEDYAQARSRFQTKLTRKGPSPQEWARATPPAGVTEVEYASGKL